MLELYSDFYMKKYSLLENRQLILSAFLNPKYKKFSHATDEQKKNFLKTSEDFIREKLNDFKSTIIQANKKNNSNNQEINFQETSKNTTLSDSSDEENEIEVNWRSVKKKLNNYILESKHPNVMDFWKENATKYPILVEYFKSYASSPATSTASERLFSKTGYQIWDRRNKISPERVEKIMFLYENIDKL